MIVVMPNGSPQTPGGGMGRMLARPLARRADVNKDGKVTEEELVAAIRKLFKECDKDGKGAIDESQLAEGINRLLEGEAPSRFSGRRGLGSSTAFENDLLKDIIPHVESRYPVKTGPESRAIAGLSMGGGQALGIGLRHLDTFAWVGGFSSALFGGRGDLAPGAEASKKLRLLWLSCGDTDSLMSGSRSFHEALQRQKVPHIWHVDSGGHTWQVWKNDLYLLAPRLFQEKK
jgi:hypothetical protein